MEWAWQMGGLQHLGQRRGTTLLCLPGGKGEWRIAIKGGLDFPFQFLQASQIEYSPSFGPGASRRLLFRPIGWSEVRAAVTCHWFNCNAFFNTSFIYFVLFEGQSWLNRVWPTKFMTWQYWISQPIWKLIPFVTISVQNYPMQANLYLLKTWLHAFFSLS